MADQPETKRLTDWERVEADYRAGILSVREIGAANGVSHTAIAKRAKRDGWERNLAAKIQAKADALVAKQAVSTQVATETAATDRLIVEANAEAIAQVRISHRTDIGRARTLCLALLVELEVASKEALTIQELADLLDKAQKGEGEDAKGLSDSIWKALDRAMQLPGRAGTLKALADSLKTLVTLEREAWGLSSDPKAPGGSDGGPAAKTADDLTDDELAAIARRGRAAPAQSAEGAN